jgi:tyrosyl-tRNA synthetase
MEDLKLEETLFRNIAEVLPSKEFLISKLKSGQKLRIYHGIDPTAPELHIGHLSVLKKLQHLQESGFEVIVLMGGMTATIGDPDKLNVRKQLTVEEVARNAESIKAQVSKILKFEGSNPAKILNNYDWLSNLNFEEIIKIASNLTHEQLIERDMFQERIKNNQPIYLHEFFYPLMQGFDSVAMEVDAEIGGTDQMFNMMIGRDLLKKMKNKEKFVITVPMLTDSKGKKIGKSEGNAIAFASGNPYDLYAGIMTLGDDVIVNCFVALTDIGLEEISIIETDLIKNGANPMVYKKQLAFTLVKENYSEEDAKKCQEEFEHTVQNKNFSENQVLEISISGESIRILDFLKENLKDVSSSEIKKVIEQNGLEINSQKTTDLNFIIKKGDSVKFGKKIFLRII